MDIKQELSENVYDKVLRHLSDMVKAKLPNPSSQWFLNNPSVTTYITRRL